MNCIAYIAYIAIASVQRMASIPLTEEYGRSIIANVVDIMKGLSTTNGTLGGIGDSNVIIMTRNSDGTPFTFTVATHIPGSAYPLKDELYIYPERKLVGTNQNTSIFEVHWNIRGCQSSHDPRNTDLPHILVDGIHILIVQIPTFNNASVYVRDYSVDAEAENNYDDWSNDGGDGSTWNEGSVVSDGDSSEAEDNHDDRSNDGGDGSTWNEGSVVSEGDLSKAEDNYGADGDGRSSWGEGSVVREGDLSETARCIINKVDSIMKDPSTTNGTPIGIGQNNVIIVILNPDGSHRRYIVATHTPGGAYPLECECTIHHEHTLGGFNQYISIDGVHWVIEGTQSFHDPCNTNLPHILVDGIHVIIVQIPTTNNVHIDEEADTEDDDDYMDYGADDDGESSWGEGSVVSEGDLSEADTESVVSENGNGDNGHESIDEIRRELPNSTIVYVQQNMTLPLLKMYISLIRGYSEKKSWIRWYVFFVNGNRLHTDNEEFLQIAHILKFAVWTCSQHSGVFEGRSYDDCVKHIVNAICKN